MSTLDDLMKRPAEHGEPTARSAALRPSFVPKFLVLGAAIVIGAQIVSAPIVAGIEKARIEAQREAADAEAKERQARREADQAARARADLERRANQNAQRVSERRASAWHSIESVRAMTSDPARPELDRESARLALEARPVPADLPTSAALDLSAAIEADAPTFARGGDVPTVNAALTEYQDGTKRVNEYLGKLEDERRKLHRELLRRPQPVPQASAPAPKPEPIDQLPVPRSEKDPIDQLPKPSPSPAPTEPARRQVTNW